jgi:succinate dehydrogenase/fumarate reductase flavoprotein subunit
MAVGIPAPALAAADVARWDREVDIVVVGSGAAACAAAVTAQAAGAVVLMLEKAPVLGGTTAKSGGGFWVPNNFRLREKGIEDARMPFLSYCASYSFPHLFDPQSATLGLSENQFALLDAYYHNASAMTDLMRSTGTLVVDRFHFLSEAEAADVPDYGPLDNHNKVPRGRTLGVRKPDGSLGFGPEMIRQFHAKLEAVGVQRLTGHRVTGAVVDGGGAVIGVEAQTDGRQVRVRARRGVIFGSGGFAYNRELLNRHHIAPVYGGCGVATNTGDFVDIAAALGAQFGNMASGWRAQIVLEEALQYVTVPADVWSPPGDSMFLVNKYGRRALNEKRNYHDRTRAQIAYDANKWEFPNQLMFMIYDHRTAEMYAGIHPIPDVPTGSPAVLVGDTWDALAERLDARLAELSGQTGHVRLAADFKAELARTVDRFNRFAAKG